MGQIDPTRGLGNLKTRREFLQVGYSGLLGLGLPGLLAARGVAAASKRSGRARSVIVILLSGGLGQHDSFDMKPEAPDGIRGEFKPIDTAVPGIRMCEHLPGLAARAGRLAIVRSMAHPEGNHLLAVHRVLTGQVSNPRGASDLDRVASRDDFPCYAAVLDRLRRRRDGVPNGVALPTRLVEGPLTWPGQDAGFLGPLHDPWQLRLDPNRPEAPDDSLALPAGLDPARLHRRRHLLGQTAVPSTGRCVHRPSGCRDRLALQWKSGPSLGHRARRSAPGRSLRPAFVRPVAAPGAAAGRSRRADRAGQHGDRPDLGHARRQFSSPARQSPSSAGSGGLGAARRSRRSRLAGRNFDRDARRVRPNSSNFQVDAGGRPRARPLAEGLLGGLRRRGCRGRPAHRQVRPARCLSLVPRIWSSRPGRDDLSRSRRRSGDRTARPARPALAALHRRVDVATLHDRVNLTCPRPAHIFWPRRAKAVLATDETPIEHG